MLRINRKTRQKGMGIGRGGEVREGARRFERSLVKSLPENLLKVWEETH